MLKTPQELLTQLGAAIRDRRLAQNWSQQEAAERAGMGVRTWRRLEATGQATTENLVNAAIALRAEDGIENLFPYTLPQTMDELLQEQRAARPLAKRRRVRAVRRAS